VREIGSLIFGIKKVLQDYINQGYVWKVQIDSYERELERYGEFNIENLEYIFFKESMMVTCVLDNLSKENTQLANALKWKTCILSIDSLLTGLQFDLNWKTDLLRFLSKNFFNEFNDHSTLKDKLGQRYREIKIELFQFLNTNDSIYHKAVEDYSKAIAEELQSIKKQNTTPNELFDLCGSMIHMLCNRFFRSRQRLFELVIYDIMFKHYQSLLLRTIKEE
jgi:thiopeptide-type bacteriocin biosynthesis protein